MNPVVEALDALASAVFGGPAGKARLDPLLDEYDLAVGDIKEEDDDAALLHAIRTDWALLDATPYGEGPGATWAWRAARGRVEGVEPDEWTLPLASSLTSIFEVWPGSPSWLRDVLRGITVPVLDPLVGVTPHENRPGAHWETRVVVLPEGARLLRPALEYPPEVMRLLPDTGVPARPMSALQQMRRHRLAWARGRRRGPMRL